MAHYRKPIAAAVALNTGIFVVEAVAGLQANSLSLIMDSVHNLSDEMALVFIYLAFILSQGVSRNLLRTGRSGGRQWSAALAKRRRATPQFVAAAARPTTIATEPINNIGDVYVSLAPVLAGVLVTVSGYSLFDPLIAGGIALWLIGSTLREVIGSHEELIWPEKIVCGHSDHDETAPAP